MKKVIKITTQHTIEDLADIFDELCDIEQTILVDLEQSLEDSVDFCYNGKTYDYDIGNSLSISVFSEEELKNTLGYYDLCNLSYTYEDITEEVLFDQHDAKQYGDLYYDVRNLFDRFIHKNLTQDMVLDKILLYGIDSLSVKDKSILDGKEIPAHFSIK